MRGHKRYRSGAELADARLAELIAAVESGHHPELPGGRSGPRSPRSPRPGRAHRPTQDRRTGDWAGWSPKTAKTVADNFRCYLLPSLGWRRAQQVSGVELNRLYQRLLVERGLSATVVMRCHGQLRSMFNWAVRQKLVVANPALAADPPKIKPRPLAIPDMSEVRGVQQVAPPDFGTYIQLAATVSARRGTLVALRWRDVDLRRRSITFPRAIAESLTGFVEKGTKADRPYTVSLGRATIESLSEHRLRSAQRALSVGAPVGRAPAGILNDPRALTSPRSRYSASIFCSARVSNSMVASPRRFFQR